MCVCARDARDARGDSDTAQAQVRPGRLAPARISQRLHTPPRRLQAAPPNRSHGRPEKCLKSTGGSTRGFPGIPKQEDPPGPRAPRPPLNDCISVGNGARDGPSPNSKRGGDEACGALGADVLLVPAAPVTEPRRPPSGICFLPPPGAQARAPRSAESRLPAAQACAWAGAAAAGARARPPRGAPAPAPARAQGHRYRQRGSLQIFTWVSLPRASARSRRDADAAPRPRLRPGAAPRAHLYVFMCHSPSFR